MLDGIINNNYRKAIDMAKYLGLDKSNLNLISNIGDSDDIFGRTLDLWGNSVAVRIPKKLSKSLRLKKGTHVIIKKMSGSICVRSAAIDYYMLEDITPYFSIVAHSNRIKIYNNKRELFLNTAQGIVKDYTYITFVAESYINGKMTKDLFSKKNLVTSRENILDDEYFIDGVSLQMFGHDSCVSLDYRAHVKLPKKSAIYEYYSENQSTIDKTILVICDFQKTKINGKSLYSYILENRRQNNITEKRNLSLYKTIVDQLELKDKRVVLDDLEGIITGEISIDGQLVVRWFSEEEGSLSIEHVIDILSRNDREILNKFRKIVENASY